jgi:hypothetical protein
VISTGVGEGTWISQLFRATGVLGGKGNEERGTAPTMWYMAARVYRVERQADFVFETPRAYKRLYGNVNEEAREKVGKGRKGRTSEEDSTSLEIILVRPNHRS